MKIVWMALCFLLCAVGLADGPIAPEAELPSPDLKEIVVAGPYCGVYSLYACLDVFGIRPPMEELLTPEFVGSHRGSTTKELIAAAEKYDIRAKSYGNMTWRQLFDVKEPMILHFRGGNHSDFNHWVAFLGIEGKHLRIIDTPHEMTYLSVAELLAHWDGTAIVLSKNAIQDDIIWKSRLDYLAVALCLLGGVLPFKTFIRAENIEPSAAPTRRIRFKKLFIQTVSIVGIVGFISVLFHAVADTGFLKNPVAVAEITRRYHAVDVPEISVSEMKQIVEQNEAIIFDTRFRRDYQRGTIPDAVNLPIDSSLAERKEVLRGVDKSAKIVLYCQSAGCGFADEVASFLKFNGYRNVSLFRGGYREWSTNTPSQ